MKKLKREKKSLRGRKEEKSEGEGQRINKIANGKMSVLQCTGWSCGRFQGHGKFDIK